jgi:hypothetical protein
VFLKNFHYLVVVLLLEKGANADAKEHVSVRDVHWAEMFETDLLICSSSCVILAFRSSTGLRLCIWHLSRKTGRLCGCYWIVEQTSRRRMM